MKKIVALLLVLVLAVGMMAGCAKTEDNKPAESTKPAADDAAPADDGKTYEFKLATFVNENEDNGKVIAKFVEEVNTRTNGKIKITPFYGGSLIDHNEIPASVTTGAIEMGMYAPNIFVSQMPLVSLVTYNLSIDRTREEMLKAAQDLYFENAESKAIIEAEETRLNTKFLSPQVLGTLGCISGKSFNSVADLAGKKVTSEGGMDNVWKEFGLVPVMVNVPDLYESFSRNVVDVVSLLTTPIAQLKLDEVGTCYREWKNYCMIGLPMCINMDKWNELTPDLQDALLEASKAAATYSAELNEASTDAAWEQLKAGGVDCGYFPDEDRAKYTEYNEKFVIDGVWAQYTKDLGCEAEGAKLLEIWKGLIQD